MIFKKYNDGKWRARAKNEDGVLAQFTSSVHPSEVDDWVTMEGVETSDGLPVCIPAPERAEVDLDGVEVQQTEADEVQKANFKLL